MFNVHVKLNFMSNSVYEDELIKGCLRNDPRSQELLYKYYYGYAISLCIRYLGDRDNAAEVMNEAFFKLFSKIQKYDHQKSFRAWLRRILINSCIDFHRNNKKNTYLIAESEHIEDTDANELPLQGLKAEDILKLLSQIPDKYRITFNLYEIEGFSHDEIASMLNIPASTSRSNLTRAKKKLRELLEKNYSYVKF